MSKHPNELFLLQSIYHNFDQATKSDRKLDLYYQAVRFAAFEFGECDDSEKFRSIEDLMVNYYQKLLFFLYRLDLKNENINVIDILVNELTPDIQEVVLKSDVIYKIMFCKIDAILKAELFLQKIDREKMVADEQIKSEPTK